ncbi:hypothetical protein [Xanthomonas arboricola]|uniref:hypothetical protein n=1 Tax=Xanthomonas arboricola TaxID=56448 RepID=UPI000CEE0324|nr:hypothetical protein [Xanthomonas arboricola]PPU41911.1 hypothetical protein XaplCFBP3123_01900 [Xanthomonas arboricola pv. populi]
MTDALRADKSIPLDQLEAVVNTTGYTVLSDLGAGAAIRVFALNVLLFPASGNALDSLAEAYKANGDLARSSAIRQRIKDMPTAHRPIAWPERKKPRLSGVFYNLL